MKRNSMHKSDQNGIDTSLKIGLGNILESPGERSANQFSSVPFRSQSGTAENGRSLGGRKSLFANPMEKKEVKIVDNDTNHSHRRPLMKSTNKNPMALPYLPKPSGNYSTCDKCCALKQWATSGLDNLKNLINNTSWEQDINRGEVLLSACNSGNSLLLRAEVEVLLPAWFVFEYIEGVTKRHKKFFPMPSAAECDFLEKGDITTSLACYQLPIGMRKCCLLRAVFRNSDEETSFIMFRSIPHEILDMVVPEAEEVELSSSGVQIMPSNDGNGCHVTICMSLDVRGMAQRFAKVEYMRQRKRRMEEVEEHLSLMYETYAREYAGDEPLPQLDEPVSDHWLSLSGLFSKIWGHAKNKNHDHSRSRSLTRSISLRNARPSDPNPFRKPVRGNLSRSNSERSNIYPTPSRTPNSKATPPRTPQLGDPIPTVSIHEIASLLMSSGKSSKRGIYSTPDTVLLEVDSPVENQLNGFLGPLAEFRSELGQLYFSTSSGAMLSLMDFASELSTSLNKLKAWMLPLPNGLTGFEMQTNLQFDSSTKPQSPLGECFQAKFKQGSGWDDWEISLREFNENLPARLFVPTILQKCGTDHTALVPKLWLDQVKLVHEGQAFDRRQTTPQIRPKQLWNKTSEEMVQITPEKKKQNLSLPDMPTSTLPAKVSFSTNSSPSEGSCDSARKGCCQLQLFFSITEGKPKYDNRKRRATSTRDNTPGQEFRCPVHSPGLMIEAIYGLMPGTEFFKWRRALESGIKAVQQNPNGVRSSKCDFRVKFEEKRLLVKGGLKNLDTHIEEIVKLEAVEEASPALLIRFENHVNTCIQFEDGAQREMTLVLLCLALYKMKGN